MRLRHIEIFHAVYTSGSITNAAKQLYVSQPSVSKVLAHAELQLGFLLFKRVKGRLIPTNEAVLLFDEVDRVYQQMNTIKNAAENIKNNQVGRISLALSPALGFDVLPTAVARYNKEHPNVVFDIHSLHNNQVHEHLQRYKSELAIMFDPQETTGIKEILFGKGKIVAVYPKSLINDAPKTITLKSLLEHPLIDISGSGPVADLIWQEIEKQNLTVSNKIKVQTYFIAVNLVKHGLGVCLVDEFTARSQESAEIGIMDIKENLKFNIKGLYLSNKPLSLAAQDFIQYFSLNL